MDRPGADRRGPRSEVSAPNHGEDPTDCFVIVEDGRDIGYIQSYVIADHPEYAELVDVEERAAGIDLFIGEPDRVHRGLGPPLLRQFLQDVVFAKYDVESCIIGPSVKNTSAIRAYEKAGFSYFKTINVPDEDDPEYSCASGVRSYWGTSEGVILALIPGPSPRKTGEGSQTHSCRVPTQCVWRG